MGLRGVSNWRVVGRVIIGRLFASMPVQLGVGPGYPPDLYTEVDIQLQNISIARQQWVER